MIRVKPFGGRALAGQSVVAAVLATMSTRTGRPPEPASAKSMSSWDWPVSHRCQP